MPGIQEPMILQLGNKNTLLGASTAASAAAGTNQIVIGYGASGQADNSVTLGDANVTSSLYGSG